jgi:hypothetical protein
VSLRWHFCSFLREPSTFRKLNSHRPVSGDNVSARNRAEPGPLVKNPFYRLVSSSFPQNPEYDFNQESRASQPLKIAGNFRPVRSNEEAASFSCESQHYGITIVIGQLSEAKRYVAPGRYSTKGTSFTLEGSAWVRFGPWKSRKTPSGRPVRECEARVIDSFKEDRQPIPYAHMGGMGIWKIQPP